MLFRTMRTLRPIAPVLVRVMRSCMPPRGLRISAALHPAAKPGHKLAFGLVSVAALVGLSTGLAPARAQGQAPSAPQLRIEAGMHTATIRRIAIDAQGRWAVTASEDKTARVWDVASGRLLEVLRPPLGAGDEGKLYSVALSPDGSTVAVGGWTKLGSETGHTVYLFDRSTGQLLKRLPGLPNVILHLAFSPDGRWLAASLGGAQGVRVWDWRSKQPPAADTAYQGQSQSAQWGPGGRLITSSYDGKLRLYAVSPGSAQGAPQLERLVEVQAPGGSRPLGLAFRPDGREVAVGYEDSTRVDILDADRLSPRHAADTSGVSNGNLGRVTWTADGQHLLAAGRWRVQGRIPVRRWPAAGRGAPVDVPTAANTVFDMQPLPDGRVLVAAGDPTWGVLNPTLPGPAAWQPQGLPPTADLRGSVKDFGFALAGDGQQVQFGFEPRGQAPHRFDLRRRSLQPGKEAALAFPRTEGLAVKEWEDSTRPTLNGKALPLDKHETARSLAVSPDGRSFALGTDYWLRLFQADGSPRWAQPVPGTAWGVHVPASGRMVVAAYGDGTIRWHRLSDGQELLAFFAHADRKRWVLWTPSGYYDASPGGEDLIGWHLNRGVDAAADFFPASRFREAFYRPDVIDRMLDTLDEGQALAQANAARGSRPQAAASPVTSALPPVVELPGGTELRTSTATFTLAARARVAGDAPVTGWRLRLNGQAVSDTRGLGRVDAASANATAERVFELKLPPQDSVVEVFAENRHGVSTPATLRITWAGAAPAAAPAAPGFQIQPKLYVLAVGVGSYAHKDISRLSFPAKDAKDFAAALQRQKGKLYREVEVKLLTEAQASRDEVIDGLDWLQKQVTQHDVGMVFIAGHGLNDPSLGYTFLPVNADPDKLKRTGVSMSDVRSTLANLAGKGLFFFDTCHAGNVLGAGRRAGPNDVNAVINDLASAENGTVVFSSSTGRQFSYEDQAWGNGAFTKALVEGLNGAADLRKDGRITHKMLDVYVSDRVKQLTGGKQSPVTQAPGGVPDFPIAIK